MLYALYLFFHQYGFPLNFLSIEFHGLLTVDPEASLVDGEGSADDGGSGIVLSSDLAGSAVASTALL